jgi:CheY-like chemotaxis protein
MKMEAVGRLAGGVAHDFNNLLMVVTGAAELLRRGLGNDAPKLAQVRMIQKAAADAADLTRQLLAFSRRQTLEPRVLDLNQVLADMAEMLSRVIEESIEQRIVLDPGLGRVRADPGQMRQVVLNLAVNARDAMPEGGTLTLETGNVQVDEAFARAYPGLRPGAYVRLAVRDTGGGMDGETSARIFEPFFTTKEKGKGTGLGLATVYGIVKQSGGHIRAESELGRGSTFTVLLPRFLGPSEPARSPEAASPPRAPEGGRAGSVLLVEDSAEVRATLREYLVSEGFALVEATCAEDARELVRRGDTAIDVVVADVVLPGKSGIHLSQDLASLRPGLPVILMSGYAEGTVEALPAPGPLLLKKPFPLETLAAAVRERLGASRA